ncbi:MAG: hypothetical protein ABA06_04410 [Parcubacteria bacterium C7867-001]|nr:MAG: hypothetical protein ABA06_04410 [Parcubacteria bacterium C7867-001]
MPKIEKVEGETFSLRVTRRKSRKRSKRTSESARIRVKCGCCDEAVEISHDDRLISPASNFLEINGVMGTVQEWRHVFAPLLGFQPVVSTAKGGAKKTTWESLI